MAALYQNEADLSAAEEKKLLRIDVLTAFDCVCTSVIFYLVAAHDKMMLSIEKESSHESVLEPHCANTHAVCAG